MSIGICIVKQSGALIEEWLLAKDIPDAIEQAYRINEELGRELEFRNSGVWHNAPSEGKHELRGGYTLLVRYTE